MHDKPRLLIVEDMPGQSNRLKRITTQPQSPWTENTGVVGFRADTALTVHDAREQKQRADEDGDPYEVVLLDLRLPQVIEDDESQKQVEHGLALLREFTKTPGPSVVVLTAFADRENIVQALRGGASDFLSKPFASREDEHELFVRLIHSVGKHRDAVRSRLTYEQSLRFSDQGWREARYRLSENVSKIASEITNFGADLSSVLGRTYGLDPHRDAEDPILRLVSGIQDAAERMAQATWTQTDEDDLGTFAPTDVRAIVEEEALRVRPSYFRDRVVLEIGSGPAIETATVERDLRAIVAELFLGVLNAATAESKAELSVDCNGDRKNLFVSLTYTGATVSPEVTAKLEQGSAVDVPLLSKHEQSYIFMWRLARNLGVRVELLEQREGQGIRLVIPIVKT